MNAYVTILNQFLSELGVDDKSSILVVDNPAGLKISSSLQRLREVSRTEQSRSPQGRWHTGSTNIPFEGGSYWSPQKPERKQCVKAGTPPRMPKRKTSFDEAALSTILLPKKIAGATAQAEERIRAVYAAHSA